MAAEALRISRGQYAVAHAAVALARAGAVSEADALIEELGEKYPKDTLVNAVWIPTARAGIELHRGNANGAIASLRAASPYERAYVESIYARGEAYLRLRAGKEAAAEFQKVLALRGVWAWPYAVTHPYALAQLGLARAYAMMDETDKSRGAYEEFFELWKDADPDIPILLEAQAEYAKLG